MGLRFEALGQGLTEKVTLDKDMKGRMKGNTQDLGEGLVRRRKQPVLKFWTTGCLRAMNNKGEHTGSLSPPWTIGVQTKKTELYHQ